MKQTAETDMKYAKAIETGWRCEQRGQLAKALEHYLTAQKYQPAPGVMNAIIARVRKAMRATA